MYPYTLGSMIEELKMMAPDTKIKLGNPHSYRGYSESLAFEEVDNTVGELLKTCEACVGKSFEGFKGGDYVMGINTTIYVSACGEVSNDRLFLIHSEGTYSTIYY